MASGHQQSMMQLLTVAFRPFMLTCTIYQVAHWVGKSKSSPLFAFVIKEVKSPLQDAQLVKTVRRPKLRGLKAADFGSQIFTAQRINSTPNGKGVLGQIPASHLQVWKRSAEISWLYAKWDGRKPEHSKGKSHRPRGSRGRKYCREKHVTPQKLQSPCGCKVMFSWHSLGIPDTSFRGRNTRTARRVRRSKSVPAVARILNAKEERGGKLILDKNSSFQSMDKWWVKPGNIQAALNFPPVITLQIASTENHQFTCSSRAAEPCSDYKKITISAWYEPFIHREHAWLEPLKSSTLCL